MSNDPTKRADNDGGGCPATAGRGCESRRPLEAVLAEQFVEVSRLRQLLQREMAERQRLEALHRQSEAHLRTLLDSAYDAIFIHGADGSIIEVNDKMMQMFQISREDARRYSMGDDYSAPDSDPDQLRQAWNAVIGGEEILLERRMRRPADGSLFDAEMSLRRICWEERHVIRATVRDITERKMAEMAERELSRRYREILELTPLAAICLDPAGRITFCNNHLLNLTGYSWGEVVGRIWFDLFVPAGQEFARTVFANAIKVGSVPVNMQYDIVTRTGERHFISWTSIVLRDDRGMAVGISSIGEDITERRKAEDLLVDYQGRLASLAAELSLAEEKERRRIASELHDGIVQDLAFTKMELASLVSALTAPSFRESVEKIGTHLDQSIQGIRSLTFEISPPLLYEVGFDAAAEWLAERFQHDHNITVHLHRATPLSPLPEEISVTLFQVMRELLINVAKHARAGQVQIHLRKTTDCLHLVIADDGAGFDPVKLTSGRGCDRGFGLFSIRHRIERQGGTIDIDTAPGRGTSTVIALPLRSGSRKHSPGASV